LLSLSLDGYVTRFFSFPSDYDTIVSNNPSYYQPLYLISLGNSSTVTYSWYSTTYDLIDGTMRVYRCNENGSKNLVESTPISSGVAYANIELVNTPYAYDVIVDGVVYQQSFYECHPEYSTDVTYYVDFSETPLNPVIGLFLIDCTLVQSGSSDVVMSWGANQYGSASIQGCLVFYGEGGISGLNELSRTCENSTSYTLTGTAPAGTFNARGEITQGGYTGQCQDVITFDTGRANNFGIMGLFATVLLVLGGALLFVGLSNNKPEIAVIGGGVGLLLAWILGILSIGWIPASAALLFIIMAVVVGRYGRKRSQ